jgi:type II secretory pathway component PulF
MITFPSIRLQYQACAAALKQGQPVTAALRHLDTIKGLPIAMDTDHWIKRLDDIAETQLQSTQERMSQMVRMIEPIMISITGGIIIMIIMTVFTPLYEQLHVMV